MFAFWDTKKLREIRLASEWHLNMNLNTVERAFSLK